MPKRRPPSTKTTERNDNDFYPTPEPLAEAIVARVKTLYPNPTVIVEPSAGSGAFVRQFKKYFSCPVVAVELRKEEEANLKAAGADLVCIEPFEEWIKHYSLPQNVLMGGNLPFSLAQDHLHLALDYMYPGSWVFSLLKMNFFGSFNRIRKGEGIWSRPGQFKHLIPIVPRPSFKTTEKASNDTNEYASFVWEVGYADKPTILLPHIVWKEEKRRADSNL